MARMPTLRLIMSDALNNLLLTIGEEHEQLERLIAEIMRQRMSYGEDPDDPSCQVSCRDSIRNTLGRYLKLACEHFEHEHQVMRAIFFPKILLENHAVAHDVILDGINDLIRDLGNGLSNSKLLETFEKLCLTFQKHSEEFDRTFYGYVDECFANLKDS